MLKVVYIQKGNEIFKKALEARTDYDNSNWAYAF